MGKVPMLWIYLGSSENRMHMPTKTNFGLDDITVFASDGKRLDLNKPVSIVADIEVSKNNEDCSADALKLTQATSL